MKILKYIFITIIWLCTEQYCLSQYYLKAKSDSISLESDSIVLFVDEYRGAINWEVSFDTTYWYDLRRSNDQLLIRIFCNVIYRAVITENTCNPVYSDTAYLFKKDLDILKLDLELDDFSVKEYDLADSTETIIRYQVNNDIYFNLTIPANLYSNLEFNTITLQTVNNILNFPNNFNYLGGINILPNGAQFLIPIKLTIQIPSYYNVDGLFAFTYFTEDNLLYPINIVEIKEPEDGYYTITANIYHFSGIGVAAGSFPDCNQYALFQTADDYEGYFGCVFSLVGETTEEVINYLRPLYIHWYNTIVVPSIEKSSSLAELELATSEFYRWYTDGFYRFFEDEFDILWDQAIKLIGEKVMALIKALNSSCISGNDICSKKEYLEAYYEINWFVVNWGLDGEIVDFPDDNEFCDNIVEIIVNDISVSSSFVLIEKGEQRDLNIICRTSQNAIISDPELTWEILDDNIVEMVNPGVFKGLLKGETEIKVSYCDLSALVKVRVYNNCTDPAEIDCNIIDDVNCQTIKELLISNIELDPSSKTIEEGDSYQIKVKAYNYKNEELTQDLEAIWSSSDEAIVSVVNGLITGVKKGKATITVEICNKKDYCEVEVTDEPDRYIMSWKATVYDHKVENFQGTENVSVTRTTTYDGKWEGSAEFVEMGVYGGFQVVNLTTTGYFKTYLLNVSRSDCGNEVRYLNVLQESMTSIKPDDIDKLDYIHPILKFENNQCYFRDPFLTECILVDYSTFTHFLGWGCYNEEYTDFKDSTQNVINGFNYFDSPGNIFAASDDCTNFYTKVDILKYITNYPIHWEVSIDLKESKKSNDLNRKD